MTLSLYEQYINHLRTWLSQYHLSFAEIEAMPLDVLFDLEVVDSKIEAAFEQQRGKGGKRRPFSGEKKFIDQIL